MFEITEPSGKTFRIWPDGSYEGFEPHSIVVSRIPFVEGRRIQDGIDTEWGFTQAHLDTAIASAKAAAKAEKA